MKIQFFSDIHLEFGPAELPLTDADIIVAAGDVGVGTTGAEWLKTGGKPTLYIAGNHEYYGGDIATVQQDIQAAVAGTKIVFLECESAEFDGVRFLGATFWTNFMGENGYDGKTVVLTHHAPLFASWRSSLNSIFKGAYCNNLSRMIIDYPIDLWIHGHIHARSDYLANDLRVVCNPRGYDGYQLVDDFDAARTVTV